MLIKLNKMQAFRESLKLTAKILGFIVFLTIICSFIKRADAKKEYVYTIAKLKKPMKIDGNWDKPQWRSVKPVELTNYIRENPAFRPTAEAKMMYDKQNIYVIFRVKDRYVRSVVEEYNGPVSSDACVEFFFSPDISLPAGYFNLETNAGGTILMAYHIFQQKEYKRFSIEDLKQIEIAHSLPKKVDPEITEPVTWTLEYRVPIDLLKKFANVVDPKPGVTWKANFYKTASKTSNPHHLTWSFIDDVKPQFHLPQFFGTLRFK
jgi:hypothetical protein